MRARSDQYDQPGDLERYLMDEIRTWSTIVVTYEADSPPVSEGGGSSGSGSGGASSRTAPIASVAAAAPAVAADGAEAAVTGEATALLGYFCFKDHQFAAAVQLVNQAALYDPRAPLVHWLAGVLQHYHVKNFEQACHAYTRCIAAAPGFSYGFYSLSAAVGEAGAGDSAASLLERCVKLDEHHHYCLLYTSPSPRDRG